MQRLGRDAPFPAAMQGRWIETNHPASELIIEDSRIACFGAAIAYDYKEVTTDDVLTVTLKVDDPAAEDAFRRANVTGLALMPEGDLLVWNAKFDSRFHRAPS